MQKNKNIKNSLDRPIPFEKQTLSCLDFHSCVPIVFTANDHQQHLSPLHVKCQKVIISRDIPSPPQTPCHLSPQTGTTTSL